MPQPRGIGDAGDGDSSGCSVLLGLIPIPQAESCSAQSSKAPSVALPVQWPCVDGPRSSPCVPAGLGRSWAVGPVHGAEPQCWPCSWGFPPPALHRAAAAGALLLFFLFCHSFWVRVQGLCFFVLATDFLSDISSGKYCALA